MSVCPHERRMDLPCPYPDCHAGVAVTAIVVPTLSGQVGKTYDRYTVRTEYCVRTNTRWYEWMKEP